LGERARALTWGNEAAQERQFWASGPDSRGGEGDKGGFRFGRRSGSYGGRDDSHLGGAGKGDLERSTFIDEIWRS